MCPSARMPADADDFAPAVYAPAVYHGGDLGAAQAQFPAAPRPWLDLSTAINAVAYPAAPISGAALTRLPDFAALIRLQTAAADAYGAKSARQIVAASGTQALIQWLPRLFPARRVAILGFTYQEYPALWRAAGAETVIAETIGALAEPGVDVAVVVNPNNPDGRLVAPQTLADLASRLARRGGLLVVDEAFMDVMRPAASLVPLLPGRGALVLRSFGKAYGLAGLRLGFAIAGSETATALAAALGAWAVSGPALEIGAAALADKAWLARSVARLERQATILDRLLNAAGFTILGGTPLFRLARQDDAAHWFCKLARQGILTRPFAEHRDWLRFGLPGDEAAWARLAHALRA